MVQGEANSGALLSRIRIAFMSQLHPTLLHYLAKKCLHGAGTLSQAWPPGRQKVPSSARRAEDFQTEDVIVVIVEKGFK